jgi:UDP-3-O-acyl-N-acetylglucosamine deacetylase
MPALSFVGRQAQAMVMDVSGYDFASNIHLFSVEGDHILVDVNSGAIHLLDGPAREFVTALIENQGDAAPDRPYVVYSEILRHL